MQQGQFRNNQDFFFFFCCLFHFLLVSGCWLLQRLLVTIHQLSDRQTPSLIFLFRSQNLCLQSWNVVMFYVMGLPNFVISSSGIFPFFSTLQSLLSPRRSMDYDLTQQETGQVQDVKASSKCQAKYAAAAAVGLRGISHLFPMWVWSIF